MGGGDSVRRRVVQRHLRGGRRRGLSDAERVSKRGREQPRRAGHSSAGQSWGEVERAAKRRVDGRGDGQWPCLRLAWSRGRATAARAPVGGVSGARIRTRQACARGEGLGGVRRPSGGKELGSTAA